MAKKSFLIDFKPQEVCIIDSVYTLLVYLLANKCEVSNVLFLFHEHIPDHIAEHFNYVRSFGRGKYMFSIRYIFHNLFCGLKFHLFMSINHLYGVKLSGMDHLPLSRRLINRKDTEFYEYEDGAGSYNVTNALVKNTWFNRALKLDVEPFFGQSSKVKRVYLTHQEMSIPDFIKPKVIWVDLKKCWDELSEDKRNWILSIYNIPNKEQMGKRKVLLFTRPFEYAGTPENEKLDLFRRSLEGIDYNDVIIKPHYCETTNYAKAFKGCLVLAGAFPLELFFLAYGVCFEKVISVGYCTVELFINKYYPNINFIKYKDEKYDSL